MPNERDLISFAICSNLHDGKGTRFEMHSSSLIFNPGPGPQAFLKRNSLIDRIPIDIEILGNDCDLPFGPESNVKCIGWHPCFFNHGAAKRILWIKHNAWEFSNRMPALRQVISI